MLTISGLLDDFLTTVTDNSTAMRTRALSWLNGNLRKLALQRDWNFLKTTATLTITNGVATMPADFGRLVCVQNGSSWFLKKDNLLSKSYAFEMSALGTGTPVGYTLTSTEITFIPATDAASCVLTYIPAISTYTDTTDATIWPDEANPLIVRMLQSNFYEYDMDERFLPSAQAEREEFRLLAQWDNELGPRPFYLEGNMVVNYAP